MSSDKTAPGGAYQSAKADLPTSEFASTVNPDPKIDLGGWTYQFTGGFRFGR